MPISARRVETFGTTIFTEVNELAQQYNALNLGQGKPDFDTPADIVAALVNAAQSGQQISMHLVLVPSLYDRLSLVMPLVSTDWILMPIKVLL